MAAPQKLKYLSKLAGKNVLIFGSTSGIGFCVAEAALEHSARLVVTGSRAPKLETAIQRLKTVYPQFQDNVVGHPCDLADLANVEKNLTALLDFATDGKKRLLDHVAFTAGDLGDWVGLADATPEKIAPKFNVRYYAVIALAKLLFHGGYMHKSADSSFSLTSGTNIDKPGHDWSILVSVGSTTEGLMRSFAVDLAPIRVNCVSPGAINTELMQSFGGGNYQGIVDKFAKETTVKRIGRPEDTAEAYLYCMKDGFVSGDIIRSNGGRLLADF